MEGLRKRDGNRNVGYMPSNVFAFYSDDSVYVQHMLSDTIYFVLYQTNMCVQRTL